MPTKTYTKQSLVDELIKIKKRGWIKNSRNSGNSGSIGNMLEDLLGIQENNLPLPNAAEWELKTQRIKTNSLLTLFHMEPSPNALSIVPYLLLNFGWAHEKAGSKYPADEKSFRQTLSFHSRTVRGFDLDIEDKNRRVIINFDFDAISPELVHWKNTLIERGNTILDTTHTPYWGFDDLFHKAGVKLKNCFFVLANEKREGNFKFVFFEKIIMLSNFRIERLIDAIKSNEVYVDFDARTRHNHGTKFRIKPDAFPKLYENMEIF